MAMKRTKRAGRLYNGCGVCAHWRRLSRVRLVRHRGRMPILYFFTFIFLNNVFGDARESPWGLVIVSYAAFAAPGLLLPVHPQLWAHYIPLILMVMWITRYIAPQVAVMFGFRKIQAKIVLPGTELVPKAREVRKFVAGNSLKFARKSFRGPQCCVKCRCD